MAPSAGESRERLHKMPEDDGKMADGTMDNPNFGNLRDLWLPCCYLICCLRYPPTVWHQVIKAQNIQMPHTMHSTIQGYVT